MKRQAAWLVFVLLAVALIAPATAQAGAGPQFGRVVVNSYDFEAPAGFATSVAKLKTALPTSTAWWGNVATHGIDGSTGLWCAGSGAGGAWPAYPGGKTQGVANFAVSDTSDFYLSDFSFYYRYPTTSSTLETLFEQPAWFSSGKNPNADDRDYTFGEAPSLTSAWTATSYNRTGGSQNMIAQGAGTVQFIFDTKSSAGIAEGPTIDNVMVTGYKYGPVRNMVPAKTPVASTLTLTWDAPARIPGTAIVDTRLISYRIWRWTPGTFAELPAVLTTAGHVTTQDTAVPNDKPIRYLVQAYDPLNPTLWGPVVQSATVPSLLPNPAMYKVYRYRNIKGGFYLWSSSEVEKTNILKKLWRTWKYEGVAYTIDGATSPAPLWRFRKIVGGSYFYTADAVEKAFLIANMSDVWTYEGESYRVSLDPSGSAVWRFRGVGTHSGLHLYTADPAEKAYIVAHDQKKWKLEGPAFYLAW